MRPVIWTILAILVVLAIVFVVIARKGAGPATARRGPMSAEDYAKFADKMDKSIARYEGRLARLTEKGIEPQSQPMVDQFNSKISELKGLVADLRASGSEEKVEKIRQLYKEVKKVYRDLGGKATEEEEKEE